MLPGLANTFWIRYTRYVNKDPHWHDRNLFSVLKGGGVGPTQIFWGGVHAPVKVTRFIYHEPFFFNATILSILVTTIDCDKFSINWDNSIYNCDNTYLPNIY